MKNIFKKKFINSARNKTCLVLGILLLASSFSGLRAEDNIPVNRNKITVSFQQVTLLQLFETIESETEYRFIYYAEDIPENIKVSSDFNNTDIKEVLTTCLEGTNLEYEIENEHIIIRPTKQRAKNVKSEVLQKKTTIDISGVVKDKKGNPIPFSAIRVKDTTYGIISDVNGEFTFKIPNIKNSVLIFTCLGYVDKEVKVINGNHITVILEEDIKDIDEVVVTGYQVINKERMTGSAKAITALAIKNTGITSVEDALEGSISGMNVVSSGRPGEEAQIEIRGVNSFTGNTSPLWIVDGMPMMGSVPEVSDGNQLRAEAMTSGIGNVAPEDIESITVLKDAAAAAIYGSQAANGVIVITTKSGHAGKTFFNITSNITVTEAPNPELYMMNSAEKVEYEKAFNEEYGHYRHLGRAADIYHDLEYELISEEAAEIALNKLRNTNTNWFKEIFNPAISQQHSLSMSGGNQQTQYYISGNFLSDKGIEPNNQYDRLGVNMKITHNPSQKVRITFGLSSNLRNTRSSASVINPLAYAIYANPYEKPYNEDGSYAYDLTFNSTIKTPNGDAYFPSFNVIEDLEKNTSNQQYISSDMNLKFEYEFLKGLTYTLQGAYNINSNKTMKEIISGTYTDYSTNWDTDLLSEFVPEKLQGSLRENFSNGNDYTLRNTLQLMKEFYGGHYLSIFAGQEIRRTKSNTAYNYFPTYDEEHRIGGFPDLDDKEADQINLYALGGTAEYEDKLSSFFMNGSYSMQDRYIFSGSIRYDGSTFVGNKNQFTPLWNVSGRWNIHNESFMESSFISRLALRAGYGYTGSIDRNASPYTLLSYSSPAYKYDDQVLPSGVTYPSKNLKWQTKEDKNIGFEMGLWKNKFQIALNYFSNTTSDVLDYQKLAVSSGRTSIKANVASISNKGWEFDMSTTLLDKGNFIWFAQANITLLNDEIIDSFYPNLADLSASSSTAFVKGYPVKGWYGYNLHSINPSDGHVYAKDDEGEIFDLDYQAVGVSLASPTVSYLGDKTPSYYGGVSTSLKYKQITLRISADYKGGHKIKSFAAEELYNSTNGAENSTNKPSFKNDLWSQAGDVTDYRELDYFTSPFDRYMFDTELEDGDYFRLNLVSLGYMLNANVANSIGFNNARLNFNVRNLATFSKYKGIDPTLLGALSYPNTRKFILSLNLGF